MTAVVFISMLLAIAPVCIGCTGTVTGWNRSSVYVTVSGATGTETEQGVRHEGPADVRASAPCGDDSSCSVATGGAGVRKSRPGTEKDAQPESAMPAREITNTRRILHPSSSWCGEQPQHPRADHRSVNLPAQRAGAVSFPKG
jgi:hypothetical protein